MSPQFPYDGKPRLCGDPDHTLVPAGLSLKLRPTAGSSNQGQAPVWSWASYLIPPDTNAGLLGLSPCTGLLTWPKGLCPSRSLGVEGGLLATLPTFL